MGSNFKPEVAQAWVLWGQKAWPDSGKCWFLGLVGLSSLAHSLVAYKEKMKELPLVSLFCSCFLSDSLNKSSYKYEGEWGLGWERKGWSLLCPVFVGAPYWPSSCKTVLVIVCLLSQSWRGLSPGDLVQSRYLGCQVAVRDLDWALL